MDELAVELGRDPMELREQNWIKHEEFPFTTVVRAAPTTRATTRRPPRKAKELFDYDGPAPRAGGAARPRTTRSSSASASRRSPRCAGSPRRGCSGSLALRRGRLGARDASGCCPPARSRSSPASSAHGQGHETAWSQIVADQLGVPFEDVEVLHGDTQISPKGLDTYGSRSLAVGGIAVVNAAQKVVAKARKVAAHLLEASEDDIEFASGRFTVRGTDKGMAIQEVAFATFAAHDYPEDMEPDRSTPTRSSTRRTSPSRTARTSPRSRSTPRPGTCDLRKYVCVDDVGNVVNPLIVEGQVHGGLAQGIAQALFEEANYDEQGTLVNGTFVDYTLPSAADLPSFDHGSDRLDPGDDEPAGRQGRRRGGHDRLDPGDRQRRARRGAPPRRHGRSRCRRTSQRVWRAHPGGQGPRHRRRRRSTPTRRVPGWARSTRTTRRERSSDPGASSTTSSPSTVDEAVAALQRGRRGRQDPRGRAEPPPGAAAAAGGAVGARSTSAGSPELRGIRERRRPASRSGR